MGLELNYINGQTPLDEEEKEGLRIKTITTRQELDEFEQLNIEKAYQKYFFEKRVKPNIIFTEKFILQLHKDMYGDVWAWAGTYRKTDKNIGVDKFQISTQFRHLLDDCQYWLDNKTYSEEEIAIRFKHRLVSIHLFPNGNGRHSRMMADIMMKYLFKKALFTWGKNNLISKSETRTAYIKALREADNGYISPLITFATDIS